MPYIGKTPTVGNFQVCDAISVVNGQAAYTLQVGGANVAPESANHMLVSLNGILQKPGSSFTISGSTMTFASNLATGDVIDFVQILGNVLDLGQPSDDTVTAAKLNDNVISGQTALAATPADTDEFLISDAGTIKRIDYSYIKSANTPAFFAYDTSTQSLSDNTATKADLATEVFDTDSNFASDRFTPTTAGKYFLFAKTVAGASTYNKNRNSDISIYKNGSQLDYTETFFTPYGNTTGGTTLSPFTSAIVDMNGSSDYVEVYVKVNALDGSAVSVEKTLFGGYRIIGA